MGKERLVKAIVSVRQSWVEQTGVSKLFATAGMSLDKEGILGIPVTKWDVSSPGFVEVVFYPRVLEGQPNESVTAFIPAHEVVIIGVLQPSVLSKIGFQLPETQS